jgi:hypothetical protein
MPNLFDIIFGRGAAPVRRNLQFRATVDHDGNPVIETVEGESISLSPEGSVDRTVVTPDRFYHCGCNAQNPLGGRCGEPGCGRVSCSRCFSRCSECHKPLCLEHVRTFENNTQRRFVCRQCYGALRRRQLVRGLVSPFITLDERGES